MYALWVPMAIRLERLEMHDEELRGFAVKRGWVGDLAQRASGGTSEVVRSITVAAPKRSETLRV
jgi:hypothetical protein